ncbi:MAG: hypothetical protein ACK53L_19145 [Pirellulaceae bacterium]|jgi:hypothetical protein
MARGGDSSRWNKEWSGCRRIKSTFFTNHRPQGSVAGDSSPRDRSGSGTEAIRFHSAVKQTLNCNEDYS